MSDQNSPVQTHRCQLDEDIVSIVMDVPGSSANVLDDRLFDALDRTISQLATQGNIKGVILISAKPTIFVAGADLQRIRDTPDFSQQQIVEFCESGREVMKKFNSCPFPTVAAIHGAAVGGGLEIAMWCDFRIATRQRRTILGLPEVKLGLVPGWAGTSRLPRLTNFPFAAQCVATGEPVDADRAMEVGLVDQVVDCEPDKIFESLQRHGVELIQNCSADQWQQKRETLTGAAGQTDDIDSVVGTLAKQIVQSKSIFPYAPTVVLEHMARTATLDADQAEDSESMAMAQVYGSPASRGLLHHYFLERQNRKQPGLVDLSIECQAVESVAIIGAGLMGKSIGQRCLQAGIDVRLLDAHPGTAQRATETLQADAAKASVRAVDQYDELAGVDLVIESVVETASVKKTVLSKVTAVADAPVWLATNTSAIPIESLADSVAHQNSFCGIHFCHPELMSLVEVICGPDTDEATVARSVQLVRQLRMTPVAINDCPGFVVNRLLAAMINQALQLYTEGYSIESIDEAVREFGFHSGPFQIIDIIGADTCMYAGRSMWENGLRCVSMSPVLPRMVKKSRLGQKTGSGFYQYADGNGALQSDPAVDELLAGYRTQPQRECNRQQLESIAMTIMAAMVVEAARIIEEEIVNEVGDIDLCLISGLSFPKRRGGLLFWADEVGVGELDLLLSDAFTQNNPLPELWMSMVAQKKSFYGS